jgi:hypothetical protein
MDRGRIIEADAPVKLLENPKSIFYSMALSAGIN